MAIKLDTSKLTKEELEKVNGGYIHGLDPYRTGYYGNASNWEIIDDKTGKSLEK